MNKKISIGLAITLALIAMTVTFSITFVLSQQRFTVTMNSVREREQIYSKLAEIDKYVRDNYYGEIDDQKLYDMLGAGYILSILYVFFGDIRHLYSVFLTLLMYLSALFYPLELLPPIMQTFIRQNPIYQFISAARSCVMYQEIPQAGLWIKMILWSSLLYLAGIYLFQKAKTKIALRL